MMLQKCLLLFLLANFIGAEYSYSNPFGAPTVPNCPYPKIEHGRVRVKQRTRLVKFMCASRYELVGNRYATCRGGQWDVPMPVCVRPGCSSLPPTPNAIQVKEHRDAWVVTFCLPGFKLIGSSAIYCNGYKWNDTVGVCVDTSAKLDLSCDFEDPNICGWTQDDLHDFDWKRWNLKTPSSMLLTGPSHDHTYGTKGLGYYMYIESTSEMANSTARLLSPIYNYSLTADGCFSFYYHMFGKDIGGLRVYQKPDSIQLYDLLTNVTKGDSKYLLFQTWGNQGDAWYSDVPKLIPMDEDFQIVIEGIRGATFISDIAIDDVSILQGSNCTAARLAAVTPAPPTPPDQMQTCAGRCDSTASIVGLCGCSIRCLIARNCCPDFLDLCLDGEESDPVPSSTDTLPETQKLVGETTTAKPTTPSTTTAKLNTPPISIPKPNTTAKPNPIPKPNTTSKPNPIPKPNTTSKPNPIPKPNTTSKPNPIPKPNLNPKPNTSSKPNPKPNTSPKPNPVPNPTVKPNTTPKPNPTLKPNTSPKPLTNATSANLTTTTKTVKITPATARSVATPKVTVEKVTLTVDDSEKEKKKEEKEINLNKMVEAKPHTQSKSSTWKTAVIIITMLALSVALVFVALTARSPRGRQAIARFRGRANHDSEVRYLTTATDDDL